MIGADTNRNIYPLWLHDLVHGPATKVTSWPIYFCRGYNFHTLDHGKDREYAQLWCLCTINRSGIVDVNRLDGTENMIRLFCLPSRPSMFYIISSLSQRNSDWYATMKMQPRGKIICSEELDPSPLQYESDTLLWLIHLSQSMKKKKKQNGDGYSETIFRTTTHGSPTIAVQAWMVLSDFNWSDLPTTHLSFGDGFFFSSLEFFFSSSSLGLYCSQMRTTCMYRGNYFLLFHGCVGKGPVVLTPSLVLSLKATHLQMANEDQNQGAAQPMNVLGVLNPSRVQARFPITNEIRTIIRSDFPGPYRNWSTTPQHVKNRWWFTFKSKFFWNHLIETEVRKMFCKCAATKLIDMISRKSKASKSRMSDRNGLGPHKHRAGSMARLISEGFEKNVADHMLEDDILSTEELTPEQKNEMYLKLVDSTQGRVFGLGALLSEVSISAKFPVSTESNLVNDEIFQKRCKTSLKKMQISKKG
ncbi:hypothetical protein Bca52824_004231 [Brassica carinata]|uniref:Uncharacterized protein n=1 Tax=Brassica carinata TaxID=52824 RepID=A0A8X7WP35_BRACI|nr:hypothetical protein Bca52824_004231 [Brassica carinata]